MSLVFLSLSLFPNLQRPSLSWYTFMVAGECYVWLPGALTHISLSYILGSASTYPTEDLVVGAQGNAIGVTIQYRLGLFVGASNFCSKARVITDWCVHRTGLLAGNEVKNHGALNAGICKL